MSGDWFRPVSHLGLLGPDGHRAWCDTAPNSEKGKHSAQSASSGAAVHAAHQSGLGAALRMQPIHDTAYPALPAELTAAELEAAFTPTPTEIRFARSQSRRASTSVLILVQLKLLQRLGYFPMLADVPPIVIDHVRTALRAPALSRATVKRYDASGTRSRHQKILRGYLHIRPAEANTLKWLEALATDAAHTKVELPDIVNVLIEELIRVRCELPPLASLHRMATQARSRCNDAIYRANPLTPAQNPPTASRENRS